MHLGVAHRHATLCEEYLYLGSVPAQQGEMDCAHGREELFAGRAIVHANKSHEPAGHTKSYLEELLRTRPGYGEQNEAPQK